MRISDWSSDVCSSDLVKDWKADTIRHADSTQFTLVTERGLVKENSPLLQARAYALEIGVVLERDPALRHPEGSRYEGKLIMPWRSEERRGGKACVRTGSSRWSQYHSTKKQKPR